MMVPARFLQDGDIVRLAPEQGPCNHDCVVDDVDHRQIRDLPDDQVIVTLRAVSSDGSDLWTRESSSWMNAYELVRVYGVDQEELAMRVLAQ